MLKTGVYSPNNASTVTISVMAQDRVSIPAVTDYTFTPILLADFNDTSVEQFTTPATVEVNSFEFDAMGKSDSEPGYGGGDGGNR